MPLHRIIQLASLEVKQVVELHLRMSTAVPCELQPQSRPKHAELQLGPGLQSRQST